LVLRYCSVWSELIWKLLKDLCKCLGHPWIRGQFSRSDAGMKPKAVGLVGVEHSQLGAGRGFQAALKTMVSDPKGSKSQNGNARRCQRITLDGEAMGLKRLPLLQVRELLHAMCSFCLRGSFILPRRALRQHSFSFPANGYGSIVYLHKWDSAVQFPIFHHISSYFIIFHHTSRYFP
jgi:hypothetical protein